MKILIILCLFCIPLSGIAQSEKKESFKSVYELLKRKTKTEKVKNQSLLATENFSPATYYTAKIIDLPLDNMPCLLIKVKDFNMPVLRLSPTGTMSVW